MAAAAAVVVAIHSSLSRTRCLLRCGGEKNQGDPVLFLSFSGALKERATSGCPPSLLTFLVGGAQDLALPKTIITRLAKGALPSNTQIQANGILAMSKSATVFINHLANAWVVPLFATPARVRLPL